MTHAALPAGLRTGGRLFKVHCRRRQEGGNLNHCEPLFYPSSRNYQSCERHITYIFIYIYNIKTNIYIYIFMVAVFSPLHKFGALIANLARDAWGLPRPRRQLPARHQKAGHCVCASVSVCCSLCFQSSPAWSTSECLPGREKPVATRRRRVCNGGPLGCSPHPARGHRPPIRGVLEWGAVNVVKYSLYLYNSHSFSRNPCGFYILDCFVMHSQKKISPPPPARPLLSRRTPQKKHATGRGLGLGAFQGSGRGPGGVLKGRGSCLYGWMQLATRCPTTRAFNFFVLDAKHFITRTVSTSWGLL